MEPLALSVYRKLLLTLAEISFKNRSIVSRSKWAWFYPKVGVASKILRALRAQLDYRNPPSTNPGSATE